MSNLMFWSCCLRMSDVSVLKTYTGNVSRAAMVRPSEFLLRPTDVAGVQRLHLYAFIIFYMRYDDGCYGFLRFIWQLLGST